MKFTVNIDFDTENHKDLAVLSNLTESIRLIYESEQAQPLMQNYEDAWQKCSWEVITFAVTVIKINEGKTTEKGAFALFDDLLNPELTKMCGTLTERGISSRVGRTAVICKKMGNIRLMEIAVRRKDQAKRVYVLLEAKEALLRLLRTSWGEELNNHLEEKGLEALDFDEFL